MLSALRDAGCGCADLFTPFFNFVNDSMDGVKEMIEHPLTHIGIGEPASATPVIILLLTSL